MGRSGTKKLSRSAESCDIWKIGSCIQQAFTEYPPRSMPGPRIGDIETSGRAPFLNFLFLVKRTGVCIPLDSGKYIERSRSVFLSFFFSVSSAVWHWASLPTSLGLDLAIGRMVKKMSPREGTQLGQDSPRSLLHPCPILSPLYHLKSLKIRRALGPIIWLSTREQSQSLLSTLGLLCLSPLNKVYFVGDIHVLLSELPG